MVVSLSEIKMKIEVDERGTDGVYYPCTRPRLGGGVGSCVLLWSAFTQGLFH